MTGLGALLLAVGVADLAAGGLAGVPRSGGRAAVGLGAGMVALAVAAWGAGIGARGAAIGLALALPTLGGWLSLRARTPATPRASLGALAGGVALAVALSPWLEGAGGGSPLGRWLALVPLPALTRLEAGRAALLGGAGVFLLASANGVVRAVLEVAGTEIEGGESRLKGGRTIGAIERLVIFALAVSGELTAAGLIASAKSILRFPELSRSVRAGAGDGRVAAEVDVVTEYFLLGSLVSWTLALAPALLL